MDVSQCELQRFHSDESLITTYMNIFQKQQRPQVGGALDSGCQRFIEIRDIYPDSWIENELLFWVERRQIGQKIGSGGELFPILIGRLRSNARLELSQWPCTQNTASSIDHLHTIERTTLLSPAP